MESCILPILPSSPPPFDEIVEDDDQFGDFTSPAASGLLDLDSEHTTPVHLSKPPTFTEPVAVVNLATLDHYDEVNAAPTFPPDLAGGICGFKTDIQAAKPPLVLDGLEQPPPYEESSDGDDSFDDLQYKFHGFSSETKVEGIEADLSLPVLGHIEQITPPPFCETVVPTGLEKDLLEPAKTARTCNAEDNKEDKVDVKTDLESLNSGDNSSEGEQVNKELTENLPNSFDASESIEHCDPPVACHGSQEIIQTIQTTKELLEPSHGADIAKFSQVVPEDEWSSQQESSDQGEAFTDFDSYFDTRPQTGLTTSLGVDVAPIVAQSGADENFGDFAAFDAFGENQKFGHFDTVPEPEEDDFGDFVEVSSQTAASPLTLEAKPLQVHGPLPLSPTTCMQVFEGVFTELPEDGMISGKLEMFASEEQVAFFDAVTDFDHASGLTAKWSWTDSNAGRSILEFVGIDPKNVIKSDKGYIYVPDFASDLSFSPLKPEKLSFPDCQLSKKPLPHVKDEILQPQKPGNGVPQQPSHAFIEAHRPLPLSLNAGALSKDPEQKVDSAWNTTNGLTRTKPIDIEEFLSLPTISSILTNPVQKTMGGRVLSEEAKRILYLIPNISYMTSSQLCFPMGDGNGVDGEHSLI